MAPWIDDIVQAMQNLGGKASLEDLYGEVARVRNSPLTKSWQATVRNRIETFSSDSKNHTQGQPDLFYSVNGKGGGVWGLRSHKALPQASDLNDVDQGFESGQEGGAVRRYVTTYERNPKLRNRAIELHGLTCKGCGFNFERRYGDHGKGFIHVHHLTPVSTLGGSTEVNPQTDMTVLCPNCHAMVHRRKSKTLTLNELRALVQ